MRVPQEPGERPRGVRPRPTTVAVVALLLGFLYLLWRTTTLGDGHRLWLSVPLYAAELWSFAQLGLFGFQAWRTSDLAPRPTGRCGPPTTLPPVDVIINADRADPAVIERSLVGAVALVGRGDIRVIDSAARRELRPLTQTFGADYVIDEAVRASPAAAVHRHGRSPYYLWLEAGQVPMPTLLEQASTRFDEPNLAVCQCAVGLLNPDSLVHLRAGRDEEALLREVVGPGLNRLGAAPWFGPASIVRRDAVESIGGFVEADPAAVERAQVLLHGAGWTSAFEARPLVRGVAPDTLDEYLEQRRRRVIRALRVFRTPQNPLTIEGPGRRKALVSVARAMAFGTGVRQLVAATVLVVTLATGHLPFDAPLGPLVAFWALSAGSAVAARWALSRGTMAVGDWTRHGWRTLGVDVGAAWAVARGRCGDMPSGRANRTSGVRALGRLRLLTATVIALDVALLVRAVTLFDRDLLPAFSTGERVLVMAIGVGLLIPMVDVLQVVVFRRQRRRQFRLEVALDIEVASTAATTLDLAPAGVGLLMGQAPPIGTIVPVRLRLPLPGGDHRWIEGSAIARSAGLHHDGLVRVGLEFRDLNDSSRIALISYCLIGHAAAGAGGAADVDGGGPDQAVAHPHELEVDRHRHHHRPLQVLTGTAAMSAVVTLLLGPAAVAASANEVQTLDQVCVVTSAGEPVVGATVKTGSGEAGRALGDTEPGGCVLVDGLPVTAELSAAHQSVGTDDRPTIDEGRAVFTMRTFHVQLVDTAGRAVPGAGVRHFTDRWYRTGLTDEWGRAGFEALGPGVTIELTWQGRRSVHRPNGAATTVIMGRIDAGDPGAAGDVEDRLATDIDLGGGWQPFVDGIELLPGRFALRLADGTTVKAEILPGQVFDVATGRLTDLGVIATTADPLPTNDLLPTADQPSPTASSSSEPSSTTTAASTTSVPTIETSPTAPSAETQPIEIPATEATTQVPSTGDTPSTAAP